MMVAYLLLILLFLVLACQVTTNRNVIVVSGDPKGHFIEGTLSAAVATAKPGHLVSIDASLPLVDNRPQYKLHDAGGDGHRGNILVLRENDLIGKTVNDLYEAGSRIFMYQPVPGDELLVRFANVGTGTGAGQEDVTLGDKLIPDAGTGNVIVTTGSPEIEPFEALETIANITEDELVLVRFTGN